MSRPVVLETSIDGLEARHGKVRDIYDLGEQILLVGTDRISAFDWVLPSGIPDKGRILTQISAFWFDKLDVPSHFITTDIDKIPLPVGVDRTSFEGRTTLCRKTDVVMIECVVRGYLSGSGWKEYKKQGTVCGIELPEGLVESDKLPEPIFTPSTKAVEGHDENISFEQTADIIGLELAEQLRDRSLEIFKQGAEYAATRGIIIADTKFEWGMTEDGQLILIDEVLTPDSSRFWPADQYEPGHGQPSYDKQFVRDWLEATDWDKNSEPPKLPEDIIEKTRAKYIEAYEQLIGKTFEV